MLMAFRIMVPRASGWNRRGGQDCDMGTNSKPRMSGRFIAMLATYAWLFCVAVTNGQIDQTTVTLQVDGNRPFVEVDFRRPDGWIRTARFLVDTGGGGFLMAEPLARDVGLTWGEPQEEEGRKFARASALPSAAIGAMPLVLNENRVFVVLGTKNILPAAAPGQADGMLPGHVLAHFHVIFDYPKKKFTLARPGVRKPEGSKHPMPVSKSSGYPRTEMEVEGTRHGFLLDTGASFTMISEVVLKAWGDAYPEWERHEGGWGEAKTLGGQTLETMIIPNASWGTLTLNDVGVASQREGTFERYMSSMMTEPIVGALGGNVLKNIRIELDYANETLYLSVAE